MKISYFISLVKATLSSASLFVFLTGINSFALAAAPQKIRGLGSLSFPTSTQSVAAQTSFNKGMLLLHVFEYQSAEKSFQEAQKIDPSYVMAYWAEAMTATHPVWNQQNVALGRAALAKLAATPQERAEKAKTEKEKAWLATTEIMYGEGSKLQRDQQLLIAMQRMSERYPADDEVQLFYSLALLGVSQGDRNVANFLKAADIAKAVYSRNPDHPGAAHYWIHGLDDPEHAAGALVAANSLAKIAPTAGHAQHMTAHIFMALGMWDEVVLSNENAIRVIRDQALVQKLPVVAHCGHYAEWLQYTYLQQGRLAQAQNLFDSCRKESAVAYAWYQAHPEKLLRRTPAQFKSRIARSLISMQAAAMIDAPSLQAQNLLVDLDHADVGRDIGAEYFSYGFAALNQGQMATAETALLSLQTISRQQPAKDEHARTKENLVVMSNSLEAAILQRKGQTEQALNLAAKAAADFDAMPFEFGPPAIIKPPHELRGELLLAAGKPADALLEFELALKTAPNRAQAMLGRVHALQQSGDQAGALKAAAALLLVWRHADASLVELNKLRSLR
jgi:tetratricopeptide (TPR) repeat protein